MTVNYPPTTHSLLSLSPSIVSFPLNPLALLSISFRFLLQLQHHSCMVFPYFFLSLIFDMGRSKIGDQPIRENAHIVCSSEREKFGVDVIEEINLLITPKEVISC